MKPYYEHAGITIFHGDCRQVLPQLGKFDLLLTDPPYVGLKGGYDLSAIDNGSWAAPALNAQLTVADPWDASLDWIRIAKESVTRGAFIFCTHHFISELDLKFSDWRRVMLLTWYKRNSPPSGKNVPRFTCEYIWAFAKNSGLLWDSFDSTLIDEPKLATGCMASAERITMGPTKQAVHPTQKPLSVVRVLYGVRPKSVLDPFMGTGTTLEAAKELGISAVGIELEEKYCEIAAKRLQQEVLTFA